MSSLKKKLAFCTLLCGISGFAQQINVVQNSSWLQEGYDRSLTIKDADYSYYNLDNLNCKPFVKGNFAGRFSVVSATDSLLVLNPGGIVDYRFKRISTLPSKCTEAPVKDTSFEKNFKLFWLTFNDNYAFFKERNIKWQQIYKDYLPRVSKLKTDQEFAVVLKEIIKKINDGHIRLEIPAGLNSQKSKPTTKPSKLQKDVFYDLQQKYIENIKSYNNGVIQWGFLKNSKTGYIVITDMNNFAEYIPDTKQDSKDFLKKYEEISTTKTPLELFADELKGADKVMAIILDDFKNTESVVIDLRFNGGGYETVALKLLSHFVTETKTVLSVKAKTRFGFTDTQSYNLVASQNPYRKKVYVLTSHNTASAAEIFALGTLSYPEIVRIGSPTAGIFSELLWKELPNGWEFSLSNEIYSDSTNKTYEGIGIPANYEINYPKERTALYDSFYSGNGFTDKALEKVFLLQK